MASESFDPSCLRSRRCQSALTSTWGASRVRGHREPLASHFVAHLIAHFVDPIRGRQGALLRARRPRSRPEYRPEGISRCPSRCSANTAGARSGPPLGRRGWDRKYMVGPRNGQRTAVPGRRARWPTPGSDGETRRSPIALRADGPERIPGSRRCAGHMTLLDSLTAPEVEVRAKKPSGREHADKTLRVPAEQ